MTTQLGLRNQSYLHVKLDFQIIIFQYCENSSYIHAEFHKEYNNTYRFCMVHAKYIGDTWYHNTYEYIGVDKTSFLRPGNVIIYAAIKKEQIDLEIKTSSSESWPRKVELASAHKKCDDYREYFTNNNKACKNPYKTTLPH